MAIERTLSLFVKLMGGEHSRQREWHLQGLQEVKDAEIFRQLHIELYGCR